MKPEIKLFLSVLTIILVLTIQKINRDEAIKREKLIEEIQSDYDTRRTSIPMFHLDVE